MKIYVVVPTFKEAGKLRKFIQCLSKQTAKTECVLVIVNGGNDGTTTEVVKRGEGLLQMVELSGDPDKFWSGLTNIGLTYVELNGLPQDYVVIANVDIEFGETAVADLVKLSLERGGAQVAPLVIFDGKVQSSGVRVKSWAFCCNEHPFIGLNADQIPQLAVEPVNFLPTRFLVLPLSALLDHGLVLEHRLPHYAADYELTHRLKKAGHPALLYAGVKVDCDMNHTGNSVYRINMGLKGRLKSLFSIKSEHNPFYRTRFVLAVYPPYAVIPAAILYLAKSFLEVFLGGAILQNIGLSQREQ